MTASIWINNRGYLIQKLWVEFTWQLRLLDYIVTEVDDGIKIYPLKLIKLVLTLRTVASNFRTNSVKTGITDRVWGCLFQ